MIVLPFYEDEKKVNRSQQVSEEGKVLDDEDDPQNQKPKRSKKSLRSKETWKLKQSRTQLLLKKKR